jgi:carbohydrate-binding DOMON domain-containing protein
MTMEEAEAATTRSRAVVVSAPPMSGLKAAGVPADDPTMGQQVPSYPIVPYSGDGSRAGGFRGVDGSGSTGYVCDKLSPSSKPGS